MRKVLRFGFSVLALAVFLSALAVSDSRAQGNNQILTLMDKNYRELESLQADFTMAKYDTLLEDSDLSQGKVWYIPASGKNPMFIRLDWTKPLVEQLFVAYGEYTLFRPRLKQAFQGKVDKAKGNSKVAGPLAFMSMSKAQLSANYKIINLGKEKLSDGSITTHLELTPITAQKYKLAEIWVDGIGMPLQVKILEKNNDWTAVLLTNLIRNKIKDGSIFKSDLPPGTKIVPE